MFWLNRVANERVEIWQSRALVSQWKIGGVQGGFLNSVLLRDRMGLSARTVFIPQICMSFVTLGRSQGSGQAKVRTKDVSISP